ncbi:MAG TPA: hypothetical protein PKE39_07435 [Ignavibacteria bacterium]|nr:hypothetical protein [Ignavibacteria bacterium]HMQ98842.1 hypothetical protein [Ignavibacteria bacterium]
MIVAAIGAFLRMKFVFPIELLNFENTLHSHSHFAILGWLYNALYIAIVYTYVKDPAKQKKYNLLFWITQVSIIGMLFTFAWQGYAAYSITFSTMHIFCSYAFIFFVLKDISGIQHETLSLKFIYGALFFLFLSSLGPWGLVVVVIQGSTGTDLYKQVIYFYLHFQYNGWFIFALIGLWLKYYEAKGAKFNERTASSAFNILFYTNVAAYTLSLLGFKLPAYVYWLAILTAFVQLVGLRYLYKLLFANEIKVFHDKNTITHSLFRFSFLALFIKYLLQLVSALPNIGDVAFLSREVTIGFIHLVMLGVISSGMLGWFSGFDLIAAGSKWFKYGMVLFLITFALSEVLLFYPALVIWFKISGISNYAMYMFVLSGGMLAGTIAVFISSLKKTSPHC